MPTGCVGLHCPGCGKGSGLAVLAVGGAALAVAIHYAHSIIEAADIVGGSVVGAVFLVLIIGLIRVNSPGYQARQARRTEGIKAAAAANVRAVLGQPAPPDLTVPIRPGIPRGRGGNRAIAAPLPDWAREARDGAGALVGRVVRPGEPLD